MKSHLLACTCLLLSALDLSAQWVQKASGTSVALFDLYFPNRDTGYVVGQDGVILRSFDVGESWSALSFPTSAGLNAVHFLNGHEGWVASDSGLYHTLDAGDSWTLESSLARDGWYDIEFSDANTGFVSGEDGKIARTSDRGQTWTILSTPLVRKLASLSFPSAQVGYATGVGYNWQFLKTTDGGLNWVMDTIRPIGNIGSLEAVFFTSETRGFIGGWYIATFVGTDDGGVSWSDLATAGPVDLYSIHFPDSLHGFACGWHSTFCRSQDGGDSWSQQTIPGFTGNLYAVRFLDSQTGFIIGDLGSIFKTSTGGITGIPNMASATWDVYPNPAVVGSSLRISVKAPATIQLLNIQGTVMSQAEVKETEKEWSLNGVLAGTYIVQLTEPNGRVSRKWLVVQ